MIARDVTKHIASALAILASALSVVLLLSNASHAMMAAPEAVEAVEHNCHSVDHALDVDIAVQDAHGDFCQYDCCVGACVAVTRVEAMVGAVFELRARRLGERAPMATRWRPMFTCAPL